MSELSSSEKRRVRIMDDERKKRIDKALREYVEAFDKHRELVDKFLPVRRVEDGQETELGNVDNLEVAIKEIEVAESEMIEKRKEWCRLLV